MSKKRSARDARLRRLYGITAAQWDEMFRLQGGRCKICRCLGTRGPSTATRRRLYTDHVHGNKRKKITGGRVRGLICFRDNKRLLGRGLEDAALHRAAAVYLEDTFDGRDVGNVATVLTSRI